MASRTTRASELGLVAVTIEGGLIAPEQVQKIASAERNAKLAASYESPKGTNLGDEIARYFRIGQALWKDYSAISSPTVTRTAEFAHDLLTQCFGFDDLVGPVDHEQANRRYRIAREAKQGRVPIVVAPAIDDRDAFNVALAEFGDGAAGSRARRSPASLLQDWLNANPSFYWGLVFAGDRVRLMRDNDSLTRPAWIEADLGAMFRDEMFADFTVWWLLTHASRFGAADAPASDCALEEWRAEGLKQGTAAREKLRKGVETALAELGQGVIEANPELRDRLQDQVALTALFEELLRTVYRLIFLAVAEDRDLLHPRRTGQEARALYAGNYSFGFWRERSRRHVARDKHHDAWEAMKITFAALERGEELLGLPALGGLFSGEATPMLTASKIPNRHFLTAMFNLGFLIKDKVTHRINWRDLKTEELGSVYESLLEIRPQLTPAGQFELDAGAKGNARKTSGSYYTPDALVETLLDSALDPVLNQAQASTDTAEARVAAILDLRIIDPACGSGHFLLGAARRMADRVARLRDEDAGKAETQAALRDVVSRCIHGVDRNPMAVELAKVALWIESVSPGQPLGFLDANIRCGDALLGVFDLEALEQGIPDDAYKTLTGDAKETAAYYKKKNKDEKKGQGSFDFEAGTGAMPPRKLAANLSTIRRMPEDTVGQVEKKREAFKQWKDAPDRRATRVACDLYTAAFLLPKVEAPENYQRENVPTTADLWKRLGGAQVSGSVEAAAVDASEEARAFHWPLAFPDVLIGKGGFDVVLGNPPWERLKIQEHEFFADLRPEIAGEKQAKKRAAMIEALRQAPAGTADRLHLMSFDAARRAAEATSSFMLVPGHDGGRYPLCGRGDVNTYALFSELSKDLTNANGRAGIIVPTGIATDALTALFFGRLVSEKRLARLFDFENREKLFPAVDSRMKFCLLTLGNQVEESEFSFFLTDPVQLEDDRRRFILSPEEIARINPNTKTAPVFRSNMDAKLTTAIFKRVPVLIDKDKNSAGDPWRLNHASTFFDMTRDASYFLTQAETQKGVPEAENAGLPDQKRSKNVPLYEAKMLHIFDHRWASASSSEEDSSSIDARRDAHFEAIPRFWVSLGEVRRRLRRQAWHADWLIGVRKITNATNERTIIPTLFPLGAVGNSEHILFTGADLSPSLSAAFVACLSSLTLDYVARQKIGGTNLNYFYLEQLPALPPSAYSAEDLGFIVPRVLELTYTSHSMAPFASDLGYEGEPFPWDEDRRAQLRAELDAWYALAYGLSRNELRYVLDPKYVMGNDYPSETFRVLQKNEIAKYGEYRTRRLVLAAYDAMIADGHQPRVEGYR